MQKNKEINEKKDNSFMSVVRITYEVATTCLDGCFLLRLFRIYYSKFSSLATQMIIFYPFYMCKMEGALKKATLYLQIIIIIPSNFSSYECTLVLLLLFYNRVAASTITLTS